MTTYPENLGLNIWNANQVSPQTPTNAGWAMALILQRAGVAKGTSTPPGSPAEGDFYILGSGATGAWLGWVANSIAVYHNGGWKNLNALDRMRVWIDNGAGKSILWQYDGAGSPNEWVQVVSPATATIPYDLPCTYSGTPTAGEVITRYEMVRDVDLAANFAGSSGYVAANPSDTYAIDVQDDGASIGTVSISSGGVYTFTTTGGTAKTISGNSRLEFIAPSGSPSVTGISGISFTLAATVSVAL